MTIILMTDSFVADLAEKFQSKLFRMRNFCFLLAHLRSSTTSFWTTSMGLNRGGRKVPFLNFFKVCFPGRITVATHPVELCLAV